MTKYDIHFGFFGNGITAYNVAVKVNNDYPTVAHISDGGRITWYISKDKMPADIIERIEREAKDRRADQAFKFEQLPAQNQWFKILDTLKTSDLIKALNDKRPIKEKLPEYREIFYNTI